MTHNGLITKILQEKVNGIYQKDIAKKAKIRNDRLSLILRKKCEPSKKELENFAKYFNCSLDDLVEIDDVRRF